MSLPPNPHPKEQPGYSPGNGPYRAPDVPQKSGVPVWGWLLIGCGGMFMLVIPVLAAILFPVFAQAREKARQTACLANEKQMALGLLMYAQDYDEKYPLPDQWQTGTMPYIKNAKIFICPVTKAAQTSYAFNAPLAKAELTKIAAPPLTVMVFESDKDVENAQGGQDALVSKPRHLRGNNFAFADGHCKWVRAETVQNFNPKSSGPAGDASEL